MNLELFCCSGGMAEGFRRAGIGFDFAVDADPDACDSYEVNLGCRPLQMDIRDLLRMADGGWRPGWLRLLVIWSRSPPFLLKKRKDTGHLVATAFQPRTTKAVKARYYVLHFYSRREVDA